MPTPAENLAIVGPPCYWKLQYGDPRQSSVKEASPTDLVNGFTDDPYFVSTSDNWCKMKVDVSAPTTSGSSYPRVELRELTKDGSQITWSSSDSDNHLDFEVRVNHLPPGKPQMSIAQIHDSSNQRIEVLADGTQLTWRVNGSSSGQPRVALPTTDTAMRLSCSNDTTHLYINDFTTPAFTTTAVTGTDLYFKVGSYVQSNTSNDPAGEYGDADFRNVRVYHPGYPQPSAPPPGGAPPPSPPPSPNPLPPPPAPATAGNPAAPSSALAAFMVPSLTIADGQLVHQEHLGRLNWNIDALCQLTTGKPSASGVAVKPLCRVQLVNNQSVIDGVPAGTQIVTWDMASADTDNMWNALGPATVIVRTAGWYRVRAQAAWASGSASERVVQIMLNGTVDPINVTSTRSVNPTSAGAIALTHQVTGVERLQAGAAVYCGVFQHTGSPLNLLANGGRGTWMTLAWEAPY